MTLSLAGYAADAPRLIPPWIAIDPAEVHAPVLHLLPTKPSRILDIGAGVGRDAAWFAEQGHTILATEPVDALREAGIANYASPQIAWLDDRLPELTAVKARGETFDLVLLSAVWAHLDPDERRRAMPNVASQVASGGRLILSIRDGWTPENRPVFPADPDETIRLAQAEGLTLILNARSGSTQAINRANGVTWLRLAFERS